MLVYLSINSYSPSIFLQCFNAKASNFTIPKTKKQTNNGKLSAKSPPKKNSTAQRKVPTQLELVPDAQGRAVKRSNTSENYPQRKLRRSWLHTSEPQGSVVDASVQQNDGEHSSAPPTEGKYFETFHAHIW